MSATGGMAGVLGTGLLVWASAAAAGEVHPLADRCELFRPGGVEDAATETCLRCHDGRLATSASSHPVNVDYATVALHRGSELRPAQEVVGRGVFLPEGEIRCVTCHDGRSPWRYGVALPPGARPRLAPNPRDPSTYEEGPALAAREAQMLVSTERHSIAVGTKPLCIACHRLD